jgi:hypothetical protein
MHGAPGGFDQNYHDKHGSPPVASWPDRVSITLHPTDQEFGKKSVYIRTAFRNEADFIISSFNHLGSPLDSPRTTRLIDSDVSVSDNFQRLVMATLSSIYDDSLSDELTRKELRDRLVGVVTKALRQVFPELHFAGVGGLGSAAPGQGTFYFTKGSSVGFLYKNLSAGEKSAFDLLLDAAMKRQYYDNTLWCIDEPETHLNTRVQGALLEQLLNLVPARSQLFLASHSIGFMRKAWQFAESQPGSVAFLDFQGIDFDSDVVLRPLVPDREFWRRTLDVALGDLADLVAPERVVLCEGRPARDVSDKRGNFDADCYANIFKSEFPNTDFMSVGNSDDVAGQRLDFGMAIQTLARGTRVIRLVDRDLRSAEEVEIESTDDLRILSRRHIESYLLDDEVLQQLCIKNDKIHLLDSVIAAKTAAIHASTKRGNDLDDIKSAAGDIYVALRRLLSLTGAGSNWAAFARSTLSPLIKPHLTVYQELRKDIFGIPLTAFPQESVENF